MIRTIYLLMLFLFKTFFYLKNRILACKAYTFLQQLFHFTYLRYFGVETEFGNVTLVGLPIIKKHKNSKIVLGKGVTLVSSSHGNVAGINHPVILATLAEGANIHLEGCGISGFSICAVKSIKIGKNSGLGANSSVYDTDFHVKDFSRNNQKSIRDAKANPVEIGENVWVAANSLILKGVTIGNNAVVGAGSIVRNSIPENTLVIGNPARELRKI